MLTETSNGANGVMLSIAEIAQRDRVSKPTVSIAVKKLVERHGLYVERDRRGRVMAVNAAQYDLLRDKVGDPSKAQAPIQEEAPQPSDVETYDDALRRKTIYAAERERLRLAEDRGDVIPADRVAAAGATLAATILAVIERLPQSADDIAAAVARDGAHGARVELRRLCSNLRVSIAEAIESAVSSDAAASQ